MKFDSFGIYGTVLHYGLIIFVVGSALLLFIYLWYKGRLDMDQEPADRMVNMSDVHPGEEKQEKKKDDSAK
jgi:hypothetical protein